MSAKTKEDEFDDEPEELREISNRYFGIDFVQKSQRIARIVKLHKERRYELSNLQTISDYAELVEELRMELDVAEVTLAVALVENKQLRNNLKKHMCDIRTLCDDYVELEVKHRQLKQILSESKKIKKREFPKWRVNLLSGVEQHFISSRSVVQLILSLFTIRARTERK